MSPRSEHRREHYWSWYYRGTTAYIALIVTIVLVFIIKGYS